MDIMLELLEDPAYRHLLLNHLPVTGLAVSWIVLLVGTIEGRGRSILFGLALVLATSGSATVVMAAGDDAYPFVFDLLDGTGRAWLDHHTELADHWGVLIEINAVAAGVAIGVGLWRERFQRLSGVVVLVTTLLSLAAVGVIAEAGGKIRHSEFRLTDPPAIAGPGRLR
jgi:hypothetical protein